MPACRVLVTVFALVASLVAVPVMAVAEGEDAAPPSERGSLAADTAECTSGFVDVGCDHPFLAGIRWMADEGISTGWVTDDGVEFRPTPAVSRQAMAVFLYRAAGSPAGPFPDPGFDDMPSDPVFAEAISWLVDAGIATGFDDGGFHPTAPVSRQAMAAFLFRSAHDGAGPETPPDPGFSDVTIHPFYAEIAWLVDAGIAQGYADGTFRPTAPVTRQAMSAFLFRMALNDEVDPETADRCEFLDPDECLLVWPSDHLTVEDTSTDTGRRLDLDVASMPVTAGNVPIDPSGFNRNDGFSPGTAILVKVPDIDLEATDVPPLGNLPRSLEADSPVVVLDTVTGEPHPVWAELDPLAEPEDQVLSIRPARNFEEGRRYVVALRNLRDGDDQAIDANLTFRTYRDGLSTAIDHIEARRPAMEAVFADLDSAGYARHDLYLAWDFTVASERNLSERMLHIRDDAFADLGDESPTFTVTEVLEEGVDFTDDNIARRVEVKVEVPNYLTGTGASGNTFNWGESGLPEQNATNPTLQANVTCRVPKSASAEDPARLSLYGHGLLGSRTEVNAGNVRDFANRHNIVFCATDWLGMANEDIGTVAGILLDMSNFPKLADRGQQGFLNFLFLGRAMKHADGFATHPAFQDEGEALITDELHYDGNSQGGIMGGALTAVAQDWTRSVLGVPGMNYSTLLRRSVDWTEGSPAFEDVLAAGYPNRFDRTLILAMIQTQWDRAEANGYAHHMTDDPYPGTPAHQVLLHVAYGDHQVSQWTAEIEARTIGASVRMPALADHRYPDDVPLWDIPAAVDGETGSVLVYWDLESRVPDLPPTVAIPPTSGADPHSRPRATHIAQDQKSAFFDGTFVEVCGTGPCLYTE